MTDRSKHRPQDEPRPRRILRMPEVERLTGRKRSALYEDIAIGVFPAPVPLGQRAVGWLSDEIEAWLDERIAARDERRAVSEEAS